MHLRMRFLLQLLKDKRCLLVPSLDSTYPNHTKKIRVGKRVKKLYWVSFIKIASFSEMDEKVLRNGLCSFFPLETARGKKKDL